MSFSKQEIYSALKENFGYDSFRPLQEEAISSTLSANDVLLILPTGGGKSICYQLPALLLKGIAIVVSPLIALMDDQAMALRTNGINAYAIHSNLNEGEKREMYASIARKENCIIYMAPERLVTESMLTFLSRNDISLIAIDEAHCVSMWGNDFRPEYEQLKVLKKHFANVPLIALTATADSATQLDILKKLEIPLAKKYLGSFERSNLKISARPGTNRLPQIRKFVEERRDSSGIIYCLSRRECEDLSASLQGFGLNSAFYHAGMNAEERKFVHNKFLYDEIPIVCATIAFGMGIDKSNIRWVVHHNMPKNLEGYYQEIGRAGRDGLPSEALLFSSYADVVKLRRFIEESDAEEQFKIVQTQKLNRMWSFANASNCRTNIILNYFGEYRDQSCGYCDNCRQPPEMIDGKTIAQKAMSAIYRSKERLTLRNLIDVLRGSERKELTRWGWNKIKTFGAGKDVSAEDWRAYITQLINKGYIYIDYLDYSKLKLTKLAHNILFNNEEISLAKFSWQESKKKTTLQKTEYSHSEELDIDLLRELKVLRKKIALEKSVPAFFIFSDATLRAIAQSKPKSELEFANIKGVGAYKLENFAEPFLSAIKSFSNLEEENNNLGVINQTPTISGPIQE